MYVRRGGVHECSECGFKAPTHLRRWQWPHSNYVPHKVSIASVATFCSSSIGCQPVGLPASYSRLPTISFVCNGRPCPIGGCGGIGGIGGGMRRAHSAESRCESEKRKSRNLAKWPLSQKRSTSMLRSGSRAARCSRNSDLKKTHEKRRTVWQHLVLSTACFNCSLCLTRGDQS